MTRAARRSAVLGLLMTVLAAVATVAGLLPGLAPPAAAASDATVLAYGAAVAHGAPTAINRPVVAMAAAPGGGYWLAASDGGIFAYGGAPFHGSAGALPLVSPIVDMAPTADGGGYWLAAEDGGVFAYGDAPFWGSAAGLVPDGHDVVGLAALPDDSGYWLVADDGAVYAFGSAPFHGAANTLGLTQPIVDVLTAPDGAGYWLVDRAGATYAFGSAPTVGSLPALGIDALVAGAAPTASGHGMWFASTTGGVYALGDAPFLGASTEALPGDQSVVAFATTASGDAPGYWLATTTEPPSRLGRPVPAGSGFGRRVVYSNSLQYVWLIEANGRVARQYHVSGRIGSPYPGTYAVYGKSPTTYAQHNPAITMRWMVRFAHSPRGGNIGFHEIPRRSGVPMQSEAEIGRAMSAGCVRQTTIDALFMWAWADMGTTVVVLP